MRLTVGPLPPAVYWRRRAVVLGALLVVVVALFYTFGGTAGAPAGTHTTVDSTTAAPVDPDTSPTVLTPIITDHKPDRDPDDDSDTNAPPTAFTLPTTAATSGPDDDPPARTSGPCSDAEIKVIASAAQTKVPAGKPVDFTIKFSNVGKRSCDRDIGADAQELKLMDGEKVIWSSDDCNARHGSDVRKFAPDDTVTFTLTWNGRRSRSGTGATNCTTAPVPAIGTYALLGRLETAVSAVVAVRLT
jgi:hypothetical protein